MITFLHSNNQKHKWKCGNEKAFLQLKDDKKPLIEKIAEYHQTKSAFHLVEGQNKYTDEFINHDKDINIFWSNDFKDWSTMINNIKCTSETWCFSSIYLNIDRLFGAFFYVCIVSDD